MAIPHAKPGEFVDVRPLGSALASAQTKALVRTDQVEVIRLVVPAGGPPRLQLPSASGGEAELDAFMEAFPY